MSSTQSHEEWMYKKLLAHYEHDIEIAYYGSVEHNEKPVNVAVECVDCHEVLVDYDRPPGMRNDER